MTVFKEYGQSARIYDPNDSDSTKRSQFNYSGEYVSLSDVNVIRIGAAEALMLGDETIEATCNVKSSTDLSGKEGSVLYLETDKKAYIIINKPRYNKIFKEYKLNLKEIDGVTVS